MCLDEPELRLGVRDKENKVEDIIKNLSVKKYKNAMITRGVDGLNFKKDNKTTYVPALTTKPLDTIGAGLCCLWFCI